MTASARGVAAVEAGLAYLDALPDALLALVVRVRIGSLRDRIAGTAAWRDSLLAARLPSSPWPPGPIGTQLHDAVADLGIARFCEGRADLVDAILEGILVDLAVQLAESPHRIRARLRGLLSKQARVLRPHAEREEAARVALEVANGLGVWRERVDAWRRVADVFGDLGDLLGTSYDFALGVLTHHGWRDILALRDLLAAEPRLRDLIAALGRATRSSGSEEEPFIQRFTTSLGRATELIRDVAAPGVPPDVRGVTRSDDLARILPAETSLLRHPIARKLFLARLAEKSLATYQVEGVAPQCVLASEEQGIEVEGEVRRPIEHAGPILLCIDTSGSMAGALETIAKAIALEAMRVAHRERRRCYLWSFSGPGQLTTHELRLDASGIADLLAFLLASFYGGTDLTAPLAAACAKLDERNWHRADLALVTDGEVGYPAPEVVSRLDRARQTCGLRVRALVVGTAQCESLSRIADSVERVESRQALDSSHR